jgi:hypothetical protein
MKLHHIEIVMIPTGKSGRLQERHHPDGNFRAKGTEFSPPQLRSSSGLFLRAFQQKSHSLGETKKHLVAQLVKSFGRLGFAAETLKTFATQ